MTRAASEFPAVVLTGPRQSGKTTLLQHLFGRSHRYRSLELPDVRAAARADPRGFPVLHPPPVVFDEIQHAPDLLPYVMAAIDADRSRPGQYLLTGSQKLLLAERVIESLAGRAARLRLLPLSPREARRQPDAPLPWEPGAGSFPRPPLDFPAPWASLLRGGYPELVAQPGSDAALWRASYMQTYREGDVRTLRQVGDQSLFQAFLRALAARSAQRVNLSEVARDLGVAVNTAKAWLSMLEATYQVLVLRPYHANVGKRLRNMPKVHFMDTGTLCALVGLTSPAHAAAEPTGGPLFETAVILEVLKALVHRGQEPSLYFWRTAAGQEVDLVVEIGGQLILIEVKLTATPHPGMVAGVAALRDSLRARVGPRWRVHPGETSLPLGAGVRSLPFAAL